MERIEKSIEVDAPLRSVYNQWTQFEEFPKFMAGVLEVRQKDDKHLHWKAEIAGKATEWDAEIYEQIPDSRVAWRSVSGAPNAGAVSFESLGDSKTRVNLVLDYQPMGALEKVGDALGVVSAKVEGDLQRFKNSSRSAAWRRAAGAEKSAKIASSSSDSARRFLPEKGGTPRLFLSAEARRRCCEAGREN